VREWVKEDELAAELKVHPKVARSALRYLEQVLPLAILCFPLEEHPPHLFFISDGSFHDVVVSASMLIMI
jgi:hypothetical protein